MNVSYLAIIIIIMHIAFIMSSVFWRYDDVRV